MRTTGNRNEAEDIRMHAHTLIATSAEDNRMHAHTLHSHKGSRH